MNSPYFYEDIERYFGSKESQDNPRWFSERRPDPWMKEIGLITILPALDITTDIRCRLHVVSLSNYYRSGFRAISYALGPFEETPIFVGGAKKSVRPQLSAILRDLRSHQEGSAPMFWADVISLEEYQAYRTIGSYTIEADNCTVLLHGNSSTRHAGRNL